MRVRDGIRALAGRIAAAPVRVRGLVLLMGLTALLAGMAGLEHLKRVTGAEIALAARPVDPRDLLRGAYVRLDYAAERVRADEAPFSPGVDAVEPGGFVYLVLRQSEGATAWRPIRVEARHPGALPPGQVAVRARLLWRELSAIPTETPAPVLILDLGADRYFADEATAKRLEKAVQEGALEVVLAVGGDGRPAIKGLILNGVRRDEGLF